MTAIFSNEAFMFEQGEIRPEHIDAWPSEHPAKMDPIKFHIEGHIPLDGDSNWLAINIDNRETGDLLLSVTRRCIESSWDSSMAISADPDEFKPTARLIEPATSAN